MFLVDAREADSVGAILKLLANHLGSAGNKARRGGAQRTLVLGELLLEWSKNGGVIRGGL